MEPHISKQVHFYHIENTEKKQIQMWLAIGNQHQWEKYKKDQKAKGVARKSDLSQLQGMGVVSGNKDEFTGYYETETKNEFVRSALMANEYKDIHSQLFVRDSVVRIFDFEENELLEYTYDGRFIDSSAIQFHRKKGWGQSLQKENNQYYTSYLHDSTTTICELDPTNLENLVSKRLYYPEVNHWKMHRGKVYYLFAPPGYSGAVFLFKETL